MGYLDRERKVLELIHKRVGWKLADEDLQGENRQREREKGRDRQMERGREVVGNRAEDWALFHRLALSQLKQPGLSQAFPLPSLGLSSLLLLHLQPLPLASPQMPTSTTTCRDSQFLSQGTSSMQKALNPVTPLVRRKSLRGRPCLLALILYKSPSLRLHFLPVKLGFLGLKDYP